MPISEEAALDERSRFVDVKSVNGAVFEDNLYCLAIIADRILGEKGRAFEAAHRIVKVEGFGKVSPEGA